MFKKPFHTKSNAAMKGSDKRKMKSSVLQQFSEITSDQVDAIFPSKSQTTAMKIQTHAGDNMIVYCSDGVPGFFECERLLYPTVYTLWKCPTLLPCLTTFPPVIDKLHGGADLMLPGVVVPQTGLPFLEKAQICSVNVVGNLAPVAIGTASMSSSDMLACGMKGKGMFTIHCIGDHLWETGGKMKAPQMNPVSENTESACSESEINKEDCANNIEESTERTRGPNGLGMSDGHESSKGKGDGGDGNGGEGDGVDEGATGLSLGDDAEADGSESTGAVGGDPVPGENEGEEISPTEAMDELLYQCLLHSLKKKVKKSDLPLLTSSLYRNYMQKCCPEGKSLDLKKSSYKKLSKFLKAMEKRELLTVKELSHGVDSLTIINDSDELRSFVPLAEPSESNEQIEAASSSGPKPPEGPPEIRQYYTVAPNQVPILQYSLHKKGSWMTKEDVRTAVTAYIKNENLVSQGDYSRVILDPLLHDAIVSKSEASIDHLKWDQVFTRFLHKMSPGYQIIFPGDTSADGSRNQIHKGQARPIVLKLERKGGNKWITIIQNVEQFSLDPKDFAHRLQLAVAASTTVGEGPSAKTGLQVTVQGNQLKFLDNFLTGYYKIPRRYIEGLDQAVKAKKKGKR